MVCNLFRKLFLGYLSLLVAPHCMLCMVGFITPARVEWLILSPGQGYVNYAGI